MQDSRANTELAPLGEDEVAIVPIDVERGLILALGQDLKENGEPVAGALLDAALDKAGLLGGMYAAKGLLDGTLVRLSPQTVARLREGAVFLKDSQGLALGTLRDAGRFSDAVRFLPGAANPVAAGLMLQTMAIQRQLGQIQEALEEIDAKLDTLIKGQQHGVLGDLLSMAPPLEELARKLRDGHEFTEADEIKLRDYEDRARTRQHEAALWLSKLRELLGSEDLTLRRQHEILDALMQSEHVGFWLRVYMASQVTLARARWLRLSRAAIAESPEWASQLQRDVSQQLDATASEIVGLAVDLDRYLRNHDIASGFEELSFKRKHRVRQLRRQLRDVHDGLRMGMAASEASLRAMLQDAESFTIPEQLSRRDVEPWLIRDNLYDGGKIGLEKAKELTSSTSESAIRSASRFLKKVEARLDERRDSDGSDDET